MRTRNPDIVPGDRLLEEVHSERELSSGKVPLRPIHRAGFLILSVFFVITTITVAAFAIPSIKHETIFIKGLCLVIGLVWFLLLFTLGRRMIWSAMTAPSEKDEDDQPEPPEND